MVLKDILINIRDFIIFLIDGVFKVFIRQKNDYYDKRILLIRTDAIGDFVLWLDVAKTIREYYKEYQITLICNELVADLANNIPYFDNIISIKPLIFHKNLIYRYKILKSISVFSYEKAIHFPYTRHQYFLNGETIIRIVRAKEKIGSVGEKVRDWRYKLGNRFYTKLIDATNDNIMEIERNAEFLKGLGFINYQAKVYKFPEVIFSNVKYEYDYIIFPGAGSIKRRWPVKNFVEIAKFLFQENGWKGLICGGPGEEHLGNEIIKITTIPLTNIIGKTSLTELISLIANAKLIISNETSAIHIAAAVNTASICLLGGGHYKRFVPYPASLNDLFLPEVVSYKMKCFNCNWNCVYDLKQNEPYPCIQKIQTDKVINVIKNINRKIINKYL